MKKEWLNFILVIGLLLLVRFFPMLFLGKTLAWGDNYSLMIPGKLYQAAQLKAGHLPLWNPYIFAGLPIINDINQSVLYFTTGIFCLFSTVTAVNISLIIHVILISLGTYFLIRQLTKNSQSALLGAALMALSTQVTGGLSNLSTLQSTTWFPWLAYFGLKLHDSKRGFWPYALCVLLQFLAGYPQHVFYAILLSVLLSAKQHWQHLKFKAWFLPWLKTAIWVLLLSAAAWLPFLEMLLDSTRMSQSVTQSQMGSLKPAMMIKMFFPYFFDKQSAGIKWGAAWSGHPNVFFYVSNFALLLPLVVMTDKKQRTTWDKFYLITIVATLLFALGDQLPGFSLLQTLIPILRFGRYPSMILIITNLLLVMWVGDLMTRVKVEKWWRIGFSIAYLLILLAGIGGLVLSRSDFTGLWQRLDLLLGQRLSQSPFHTAVRDQAIVQMVSTNLLTAGLFTLISIWAFGQKRLRFLILLLAFDVLVHTQSMLYFPPQTVYQLPQQAVFQDTLQDHQYRTLTRDSNFPYTDYGSYWEAMVVRAPFSDSFVDQQELQTYSNLIHLRDGLTPNWNLAYQIPMIHGYTTLLPNDFAKLWETDQEIGINFIDRVDPQNQQLQDWSVKYYLVDYLFAVTEDIPFTELAREGQYVLYELPAAKARFRLANDQAIELEELTDQANYISFRFHNPNQDYLIVADRYDRNWQAWINDQPVAIEDYNGMRKIAIEAGDNQLVMKFMPKSFYWGLTLTTISLLAMAGLSLTTSTGCNKPAAKR